MRRVPCLLLLGWLCGCKNDCDRAVDHITQLAYQESMQALAEARAGLPKIDPSQLPSEASFRALARPTARKRLGERCGDKALTDCILAAQDSISVGGCVPPLGM